jgi:hypothetical protein
VAVADSRPATRSCHRPKQTQAANAIRFGGTSTRRLSPEAAAVYAAELPAGAQVPPPSFKGTVTVSRALILRVLVRDLTWDGTAHHVAEVDPEFAEAVQGRLKVLP